MIVAAPSAAAVRVSDDQSAGTSTLQRVWRPERIGDAWLVRYAVKRLRSKLGDAAAQPTSIFTEPPVGYRPAQPEPHEVES